MWSKIRLAVSISRSVLYRVANVGGCQAKRSPNVWKRVGHKALCVSAHCLFSRSFLDIRETANQNGRASSPISFFFFPGPWQMSNSESVVRCAHAWTQSLIVPTVHGLVTKCRDCGKIVFGSFHSSADSSPEHKLDQTVRSLSSLCVCAKCKPGNNDNGGDDNAPLCLNLSNSIVKPASSRKLFQ